MQTVTETARRCRGGFVEARSPATGSIFVVSHRLVAWVVGVTGVPAVVIGGLQQAGMLDAWAASLLYVAIVLIIGAILWPRRRRIVARDGAAVVLGFGPLVEVRGPLADRAWEVCDVQRLPIGGRSPMSVDRWVLEITCGDLSVEQPFIALLPVGTRRRLVGAHGPDVQT